MMGSSIYLVLHILIQERQTIPYAKKPFGQGEYTKSSESVDLVFLRLILH